MGHIANRRSAAPIRKAVRPDAGFSRIDAMPDRRFPPPWSVEEQMDKQFLSCAAAMDWGT
jgi:hypothetical protein